MINLNDRIVREIDRKSLDERTLLRAVPQFRERNDRVAVCLIDKPIIGLRIVMKCRGVLEFKTQRVIVEKGIGIENVRLVAAIP